MATDKATRLALRREQYRRRRARMTQEELELERQYYREWVRRKRKKDLQFAAQEAEKARAWQRRNPLRNAMNEYKGRSRRKGIPYELTGERFEELVKATCYYCGATPNPLNGIDRIEPSLGYVDNNVVTACRQCNVAKNDRSQEEFFAWVARLAAHIGKGA
jgi:5-methylcytosine-specific restriction endonuclease McrA